MAANAVGLAMLAGALASCGGKAEAAEPRWQFSTGMDYSTGQYGSGSDIEVADVSVGAQVQVDRLRLEATVPFVRMDGPSGVVSAAPVVSADGADVLIQQSSVGDVTLGAAYAVLKGGGYHPTVEISGTVKAGTAKLGIGTKEIDYAAALNLYQYVSSSVMLFGSTGYSWLGDSNTYALKDGLTASAGVDFSATESNSFGVTLAYREPVAQGLEAQAIVSPYIKRIWRKKWGVTVYGSGGLNDASPRFAAGLQLFALR